MCPFGAYDGDDTTLKGGTDGTVIGNTGNRLNVSSGNVDITGALDVVDHEHYMVHQGRVFLYSIVVDPFANTTTNNYIIVAPSGPPYIHFDHVLATMNQCRVSFFEDATYTGGSTATTQKKHRGSNNTTSVVIKTTPTITSDGTLLWTEDTGGATGGKAGASNTDGLEWILSPTKIYLFRILAEQSGNAYSLGLSWYEAGL